MIGNILISVSKSCSRLLVCFVRLYRYCLSPFFGYACRFYPTCSCYAEEAIQKYGVLKGSYLMTRRLLRCHPWRAGGVDLVP
jgi:putative membrane protein insertion efficiency factor